MFLFRDRRERERASGRACEVGFHVSIPPHFSLIPPHVPLARSVTRWRRAQPTLSSCSSGCTGRGLSVSWVSSLSLASYFQSSHTRGSRNTEKAGNTLPVAARAQLSARALQTICHRVCLTEVTTVALCSTGVLHVCLLCRPSPSCTLRLRNVDTDGRFSCYYVLRRLQFLQPPRQQQGVWERCLPRMLVLAALTTLMAKGCANRDRRIRVSLQEKGSPGVRVPNK